MSSVKYLCFSFAVIFFASSGVDAAPREAAPEGNETPAARISKLQWEFRAGTYTLAQSSSAVDLKRGLAIVRGGDARKLVRLAQGRDYPGVEAVIVDPDSAGGVVFRYFDAGYVRLDNWDRVGIDPDRLLARIREATEQANAEKRDVGLQQISIVGWLREPTPDVASKSISWAIEARDGDTPIVNSVALKLGRKGFEQITWIGGKELYLAKAGFLDEVNRSHRFKEGYRYADYAGDGKRAGVGIGTLVAAAAGAPDGDSDGWAGWPLAVLGAIAEWRWAFIAAAVAAIGFAVLRGRAGRRTGDGGDGPLEDGA